MKKSNADTKSYIKLKCFNMYKDGSTYPEIAKKLKISVSIVDEYILAHASLLKIDINELELQHTMSNDLNKIEKFEEKVIPANNAYCNPLEQSNDSKTDMPVKIEYGSKSSIPQKQSWFRKTKRILCQIICFWK